MSATCTQVYRTPDHRRRIDEVTQSEGITMAEVIRRALDDYLDREHTDAEAALADTFGSDPVASVPSRDEWDRG